MPKKNCKEALAEGQNVDYREVSFILGRLSALQKPELIPSIQTPKYLASASSLSRTAILLATAKMGNDERKYLRQGQRLSDPLEKLCAAS